MANAVDSGFAACWSAGSRLMLDAFMAEWGATEGAFDERLAEAFARVASRFVAKAPGLRTPGAYDAEDSPCGQLLAAVVTPLVVHAAWVGGDLMLHARRGEVVGSSRPHTLLQSLMDKHPDQPVDLDTVPRVLARVLGEHPGADPRPAVTSILVSKGPRDHITRG